MIAGAELVQALITVIQSGNLESAEMAYDLATEETMRAVTLELLHSAHGEDQLLQNVNLITAIREAILVASLILGEDQDDQELVRKKEVRTLVPELQQYLDHSSSFAAQFPQTDIDLRGY